MVVGLVPEQVLLAVRLDERDPLVRPAGQAQVLERRVVDREEAAGRAVLGRHVPDRRAVGERERGEPGAEVLDELPDDAGLAEDLGHGQDEVGRGRALGQRAGQAEADHLRDEHRERLAEHRRLGLDPADAPAEHAEAVDHRRVRVGADERVGERLPVARLDHAREVLEVDLVDDAGAGRDDLEVGERLPGPSAGRRSARGCARTRARRCGRRRSCVANSSTCTEWSITSSAGITGLISAAVAAEVLHRVAHRREVDDRRDAGEVLVEDAARPEGDLAARLVGRDPARDRLGVGVARRRGARSRAGRAACTAAARRPSGPGARRAGRSRSSRSPTRNVPRASTSSIPSDAILPASSTKEAGRWRSRS